jgi:hypothetical protein
MKNDHQRILETHVLSRLPRSTLNYARHPLVDTSLKELKICTRRLHVSLKAQQDETRILERLYYKGKNQHRGALFWRRVAEIRRFCDRVDGMHIERVIDDFHSSFFGEDLSNG